MVRIHARQSLDAIRLLEIFDHRSPSTDPEPVEGPLDNRVESMSAWFHMLRLQSDRLYPGATTDLHRRWQEHQQGIAGRTTEIDPPLALVYQEASVVPYGWRIVGVE